MGRYRGQTTVVECPAKKRGDVMVRAKQITNNRKSAHKKVISDSSSKDGDGSVTVVALQERLSMLRKFERMHTRYKKLLGDKY